MIAKNTLLIYQFSLLNLPQVDNQLLTQFEQRRYQQLSTEKQSTYLTTRNILRHILAQHHIPPVSLDYTPQGKAIIVPPFSNFSLSLTHSQDIWMVGLMETNSLGIDLQIPLPKNPGALRSRCNLKTTTSTQDLMQHWCLCEAYCKLSQTSLWSALRTPIATVIIEKSLYYYHQSKPNFAAVATTPIHKILFIDGKNQLFSRN